MQEKKLIEKVLEGMYDAQKYTLEKMPWLNGIRIPNELVPDIMILIQKATEFLEFKERWLEMAKQSLSKDERMLTILKQALELKEKE